MTDEQKKEFDTRLAQAMACSSVKDTLAMEEMILAAWHTADDPTRMGFVMQQARVNALKRVLERFTQDIL